MRQTQERLHQHAGADHLRNQIEHAHGQRAHARGQLDAARIETGVERIGKRELAQPLHRLRDHEQRDDPARQVADRVQKPVVAIEGDHPADAQERRGRKIIAGERHAVHEPGNLPVGGEVAGRRLAPACPR